MPEPMIATRRIAQAAQRVPRSAAPVLEKMVAKRPRAKEGGGREEENRPEIALQPGWKAPQHETFLSDAPAAAEFPRFATERDGLSRARPAAPRAV